MTWEDEGAAQAGGKSRKSQEQVWNCHPVGTCAVLAVLQPSLARWTFLGQGADGSGQPGAVWDPGNLHPFTQPESSRDSQNHGRDGNIPWDEEPEGRRIALSDSPELAVLHNAIPAGAKLISPHNLTIKPFYPCAPQSLTEERITLLLQLIEEELEHKGTEGEKAPGKFSTEILQVHVPACILALCGWTCRWAGLQGWAWNVPPALAWP